MNPVDAWKTVVLERYAEFTGRAGRPEFWWFVLANLIVGVVFGLLAYISLVFGVVVVVYYLAILIPSIAVASRRLHDSNKSGWWLLLWFVPFGNIVLIVLFALESTQGDTRFGPAPLR
jgi:uncharacterized membrane protein YhaH (DUF805 family)